VNRLALGAFVDTDERRVLVALIAARREADALRAEADHMLRWALAYLEHAILIERWHDRPPTAFETVRQLVDHLDRGGYDPWTPYDQTMGDMPRPRAHDVEDRDAA
jgi:hypothetical protein